MKGKSLPLLMLTIILAISLASKPASSPPTTTIGTQPLTNTAPSGTNFDVDITVADVQDLYGWTLNMTFNSTVLHVVDMVEGPFLLDFANSLIDIYTWPFGPTIDNDNGWVTMSNSLYNVSGPLTDGADGDGVLATITFEVQVYGKSHLHFLDETDLTTNIGGLPTPIEPLDMIDGSFRRPLGDANGDGKVNSLDIGKLNAHWSPAGGTPPWSLGYKWEVDCNDDGYINSLDIGIVNAHWGEIG